MATPIWFSGSSPDAAFAREDQWRRERTGVLESDRASRANAEAMSMQAFLNNQAREDQLREVDLSRNWQAQEASKRSREFARQFDENLAYSRDALKNQGMVDAARLRKFVNDTALAGELEAQDYFSKPRPISDVDFGLLSRTTGLPKEKLRPMAEKADISFAENQAANLNAAFFAAQQKQAAAMKVPVLPSDRLEKLRKSIESQSDRIHPLVKFNYVDNAWEFIGGKKKSIAAPGEHVPIGRPPDTATGTTPAFFAASPAPPPDAIPSILAPSPAAAKVPTPEVDNSAINALMVQATNSPFLTERFAAQDALKRLQRQTGPTAARAPSSAAAPPTISTPQEYAALPSGARFIWVYPDGKTRHGRKP